MGLFNIKLNKKDRNINTFVCEVCKKELPEKYLHSHSVCADCANTKAKSTSLPQSTIKLDGPIRTNTEKETRINPIVSEKKEPLFEIIDIKYIELFDWNITLLDKPVTYKVAIDATNGDFYLLRGWDLGDPLCKITDKRFVEITKEISDECYSQFAKLPEAKLQFVSTSTLPHKHIDYKNILHETIEIPHTSKILLKHTSLNGWILEINNTKIILGSNYFGENTIHNLCEIISKYAEEFSEDTLWKFPRILTAFGLVGKCGYAKLQLMGSGYYKDAYRNIADNVHYRYKNQTLYISGTGATTERDEGGDNGRLCSDPEKSVFCDYILTHAKTVVFDEGITKIGKYFLSDFKVLEEIVLSSTITEFEKQSYGNCFVLPNVKHIKLYRGQHTPFDYSATIEYLGERNIKINKKERNINTFVCEVCKKELPEKYLHSHSICADCANTKLKSSYIYLFGSESDMGAAEVCGNIIVVDDTPCVITTKNGNYEPINWEILKEKAKALSPSTYLWIKDINSSNWKNYCFSLSPIVNRDIDCIRVLGFPNDSPYTNPVFDEVVIGKNDKKPYIRHIVANGMSPSHDAFLVSVSIETTFEDIRRVAKELNLNAYSDIDENNWIDRFEKFNTKESNVYYMTPDESVISFVELLLKKNIVVNEIEIEPFFKYENEIGRKMSAEQFINSFTENWRMYEFKLQCSSANKSFIVYIDGLKKEIIANWPVDINQIIS